jgi:hypothetical protein
MTPRISYGGECTVANAATGATMGRFWIDIEFRRGRRAVAVAVVTVPEITGVALRDAGVLILYLDDGRQLRGAVSTVLSSETMLALAFEDE